MTLPANWTDGPGGPLFHASDENAVGVVVNANTSSIKSLSGASKLVNIGDSGFISSQYQASAITTTGTSEILFVVGAQASTLVPLFTHFYTVIGSFIDTDPATGSISFNASIRVVSSSNPNTTLNTLYRLTFNGRTTATLDQGGNIAADPVGISVMPGDIIAVRTFLASGTAMPTRQSAFVGFGSTGGWTATTDLTAPGSAAVTQANGQFLFGPAMLLGHTEQSNAPSIYCAGDSEASAYGDGTLYYKSILNAGGFMIRAATGKAGLLNAALPGDRATMFQSTNGSFRRMPFANKANVAIVEYVSNDINILALPATSPETLNLLIATALRKHGIMRVYLTTNTPFTTSTDGWATVVNQTVASSAPQRLLYNRWIRALCPIDPTLLTPVLPGAAGALLAGSFAHPVTGIIDIAAPVESAFESGFWAAASRVATGSITSGATTITSPDANFNSAVIESGGDKGEAFTIPGAGASGALLAGYLYSITNSTTALCTVAAGTTVSSVPLVLNPMTNDGTHASSRGAIAIASTINVAAL